MNKSILIINRWNDEIISYEKYIDHHKYDVFYLTNKKGLEIINSYSAKGIYISKFLDNLILDKDAFAFIKAIKFLEVIIAFSEVDQELAAYLRTKFSVKGIQFNEVKKFRNKIEMKSQARNSKIAVPVFSSLSDEINVGKLINEIGFPIILKPKNGVSSEGVYKANSAEEFNQFLSSVDKDNYECEQFIDGKIYHVDGLVYQGNFCIYQVSAYINTCLDYIHGNPLGSVVIDDEVFIENAKHFTLNVLDAFSLRDGAFHLEFIINGKNKIYFLEIAARVGGAQVPHVFKYVYGVDLFHEWVNIQIGNNISLKKNCFNKKLIGGWLLLPQPKTVPCKVEYCRSLQKIIPFILSEKLPNQGHVFYGNGEYRDVSGIYLYCATSSQAIKSAISQTINQFSIKFKPIKEKKMILTLLKGKLHQACITHAELHYEGSCAIDEDLLDMAGILQNEQIQIYNIANGNRFTTYAITAPGGSRMISVNGAAALLANPGDRVIICAYGMLDADEAIHYKPKVVMLDKDNHITSTKNIDINPEKIAIGA
ncbi:MAG: aspartate 1-decarboxylase [Gammaproteobacteria bacterium]|nr:aspartate 1-decarboxylase [Gammaproteobacteria bacterium]